MTDKTTILFLAANPIDTDLKVPRLADITVVAVTEIAAGGRCIGVASGGGLYPAAKVSTQRMMTQATARVAACR